MSNEEQIRQAIRELIEKELEELTGTGAIDGFGTPFAFQGILRQIRKKRKDSAESVDGFEVIGEGLSDALGRKILAYVGGKALEKQGITNATPTQKMEAGVKVADQKIAFHQDRKAARAVEADEKARFLLQQIDQHMAERVVKRAARDKELEAAKEDMALAWNQIKVGAKMAGQNLKQKVTPRKPSDIERRSNDAAHRRKKDQFRSNLDKRKQQNRDALRQRLRNKTVKNPQTGRTIRATTALGYGPNHPAYKALGRVESMNEAALRDGFEQKAQQFVKKVQAKLTQHYKKSYPDFRGNDVKLTIDKGSRYWRIVSNSGSSRSVWGFLDKTNGDILKAAGWKSPAKGARGNLFDPDLGIKGTGPYGPAYKKGPNYGWKEGVNESQSLEKQLKAASNYPGKGESRQYDSPSGKRWAAVNKNGTLKDFPSKQKAMQFAKSVQESGDPYYAWRDDETKSPRMKIGESIQEMNHQLREMEKSVKRCRRLRSEANLATSDYWNRTNNALMKMESRMHNIAKMVRDMRG